MVNPQDLTSALVTKLQSIATLVSLLGGDQKMISPYRRIYPNQMKLEDAVWRMPIPSIMIVWEGTVPGPMRGIGEVWKHRFGLYIRPKEGVNEDASLNAYKIWEKIINGVPTGDGLKMLRTTIHESCYPMDPPSVVPQAGQTEESNGTFEYWKASITLTEKGDW